MTKLTLLTAAISIILHPTSVLGIKPRSIDEAPPRMYEKDIDTPTYDAAAVQSELNSNRATWNSFVGETKNYDMTFERICFCPEQYRGPFLMRVRSGQTESATYLSESMRESSVNQELLGGLLTVDGVFDKIQNGLDRRYVEIRVTYNETTGHPMEFYSDMSKMIADDETTYRVSDVALNDD